MTHDATTASPGWCAPAATESRVGGDLHAVCDSPHGLRLLIGDVRGKGTEAAVGAHVLLDAFRAAAPAARTLRALVDVLEVAMIRHARGREDVAAEEDFASALVAEFSADCRTLRLLNRGHPAPLLLRPGSAQPLEPLRPHPPLGLRELAKQRQSTQTLPFPADGTLLLLTDGTTEARDAAGAFYDPVTRLAPHGGAAPEELLGVLRREVHAHVAGRDGSADDMGMLAVRPQLRLSPALPTTGRSMSRPAV